MVLVKEEGNVFSLRLRRSKVRKEVEYGYAPFAAESQQHLLGLTGFARLTKLETVWCDYDQQGCAFSRGDIGDTLDFGECQIPRRLQLAAQLA